jgi:hypothetical protein
MTIGDILPSVSARRIADSITGLGSYITMYFRTNSTQLKHTSNKAWNDSNNGNAKGMFWIYYQNVHGVPQDDVDLAQDLQVLVEFDIGCFCLSETNLDWNRPYVQADYLVRQRKTWKPSTTSFSSIDMESSSDYMTGGTLTSTVDCWSSRVFKKDADPSGMGRWSYQTLVGKKNL